jgi:hypothetical protein
MYFSEGSNLLHRGSNFLKGGVKFITFEILLILKKPYSRNQKSGHGLLILRIKSMAFKFPKSLLK